MPSTTKPMRSCLCSTLLSACRRATPPSDGSPDFGAPACTRAVSPLPTKDAAGTPEVPAPVFLTNRQNNNDNHNRHNNNNNNHNHNNNNKKKQQQQP